MKEKIKLFFNDIISFTAYILAHPFDGYDE